MINSPWAYSHGSVVINDLVELSANNGIILWEWTDFTRLAEIERWPEIAAIIAEHHQIEPARLQDSIQKAINYSGHQLLSEALSNKWPTGENGWITFERFIENVRKIEARSVNRAAKQYNTAIRRAEFDASRSQIILEMLDAGISYSCAHPGCAENINLTIDHIKPLSRGGSDNILNLQFMCHQHNSKRGDRVPKK